MEHNKMGREIRRVPAGWEHPTEATHHGQQFKPLYDESFQEAAEQWWQAALAWHRRDDAANAEYYAKYPWYWQWGGVPPDLDHYRPDWSDDERTHLQIYETVSEGTPCSPVFATAEDLIEWMVQPIDRTSPYNKGADWQCSQGRTREAATAFVNSGGGPSMVILGGKIYDAIDSSTINEQDNETGNI
jgi:hypothetical protein